MNTPTTCNKLKRGEFVKFRNTEAAPVWKYTHKGDGRYWFSSCDDFNLEISRKGETTCYTGFTY